MKKLCLMAFVAIFAVSCGSKHERIGEQYVRFVKTSLLSGEVSCGVRDTITGKTIISPDLGYTNCYYSQGLFIVAKDGKFILLDKNLTEQVSGKSFTKIEFHSGYFLMMADGGQYLYFLKEKVMCGPAPKFDYLPEYNMAFTGDGGKYGVYNTKTGKLVVPLGFENLIYAIAQNGETAFYSGNQKILPDGKLSKAISTRWMKAMKNEAAKNETPWPEKGYGVVKVKTLR